MWYESVGGRAAEFQRAGREAGQQQSNTLKRVKFLDQDCSLTTLPTLPPPTKYKVAERIACLPWPRMTEVCVQDESQLCSLHKQKLVAGGVLSPASDQNKTSDNVPFQTFKDVEFNL